MSGLILPEATPPQVSVAAADKLIDHIFTDGLVSVYDASLFFFRQQHPAFRDHLLGFTFEQNGLPVENTATYAAFRIGAVITSFAYLESSYELTIDESALKAGQQQAEQEGVPGAFITRTVADPELQRILSILPETPLTLDFVTLR